MCYLPPAPTARLALNAGMRHRAVVVGVLGLALQIGSAFAAQHERLSEDAGPWPPGTLSDERLTVSKIHGRAVQIKNGRSQVLLKDGAVIDVNRPVSVGSKSRLDLQLQVGGTLELGPGAELVLYPVSRAGRENALVTGMRLDQGYLKLALPMWEGIQHFEVSFGRWSARLQPGEYLIETHDREAVVCTISGSIRMSGVPEWTAAPDPTQCVQLSANPPTPVSLSAADWEQVQSRRALRAVVSDASRRERNEALTRLESEVVLRTKEERSPESSGDRPRDTHAEDLRTEPPLKMPRVRRTPLSVPQALPVAGLDTTLRRLDRQIARQQSRLADALVGSTARALATGDVIQPPSIDSPPAAVSTAPPILLATPAAAPDVAATVPASDHATVLSDTTAVSANEATASVAAPEPAARDPTHDVAAALAAYTTRTSSPGAPFDFESSATGPATPAGATSQPAPVQQDPQRLAASAADPTTALTVPSHSADAGLVQVSLAPASKSLLEPDAAASSMPELEWIVNVGSFETLEMAEGQAKQLQNSKFRTTVRRETVRGRTAYRVVIEGLPSEQAAYAAQQLLVSQFGLHKAWVFRKR